jgi:hypothetical protein
VRPREPNPCVNVRQYAPQDSDNTNGAHAPTGRLQARPTSHKLKPTQCQWQVPATVHSAAVSAKRDQWAMLARGTSHCERARAIGALRCRLGLRACLAVPASAAAVAAGLRTGTPPERGRCQPEGHKVRVGVHAAAAAAPWPRCYHRGGPPGGRDQQPTWTLSGTAAALELEVGTKLGWCRWASPMVVRVQVDPDCDPQLKL